MSLSVCAGSSSSQQMVFNSFISMELKWVTRSTSRSNNSGAMPRKLSELKTQLELPQSIPVIVSTNRKDVNLIKLRDLYVQCNHSCHRFPNLDSANLNVNDVLNVDKLQTAVCHSAVVVSVFCKYQWSGLQNSNGSDEERGDDPNISYPKEDEMYSSLAHQEKKTKGIGSIGDLIRNLVPGIPSKGQLVGFGRAVSDCGLTASIHDVMVIPPLRGMGIGKLIVRRIIRTLTNRDIYDISAICSEDKSLFFEACGFGDDVLGSTTMMYTKNRVKPPHG